MALAILMTMPAFAEKVSPETARNAAITFLNNNGAKTNQLTDLSIVAGFPNLYIFTTENSFVVMPADDCVKPVLGYSLSNKFVTEGMPENINSWLQGYSDGIQYAIDHQMRASSEVSKKWKDLIENNPDAAKATAVVDALIQTKWNQNGGYFNGHFVSLFNNLCPAVSYGGSGGHAYTGCVATAMAQIMKYWNYPSQGIGSHSYTWNGQTLSADFGSTVYDWQHMTNTYSNLSTSEEKYAVDELMYHCGVSVNMNYGSGGSSASTYDVMNALQAYFNYAPNMEYKSKDNYNDPSQWIALLKAELNLNRPLQYRGSDAGGAGGHSFVCDGYDNQDNFHFNWGWAGWCDGFYSLDDMEPGTGGTGAGNGVYTVGQSAIFGIQPSSNTSVPTNLTYTLTGLRTITLNWEAVTGASSYNIYCNDIFVGNSTVNTYTENAPFGTDVYYIRSVNSNNELSLPSNSVTVTIAYQTPIVDDLSATLTGNNASLSWTVPEWCYPETETTTLSYGNGNVYYSWDVVCYAHRHLAANLAQYSGMALYKVSTYVQYAGTYSVYIYTGTTSNNKPRTLAASKENIPVANSSFWLEIDLNNPIILSGTDDLWIVMKQTNTGETYPTPSFNLDSYNANACYQGSSPTNLTSTNSIYSISWFIRGFLTDGTYTYNLYDGTSSIASNISGTTYSVNNIANNTAHQYTIKTNYYAGESNPSNMVGFTKGNASLSSLDLGENDKMTVTENSKLTVSGTVSNTNVEHLILEDGAQLIHNSNGVKATVKKNITPYTEGQNDGWHIIASPISEGIIPTIDNGLLANNYDLYYFNQSEPLEWRNYKAQNFNISNKTGYLYANSGNTMLSFAGTLVANTTATTLAYDNNATFKGFNLIGNPYPCNTYISGRSFYVIQEGDNGSEFVLGSNPIPPCAAILVQAQGSGESVTFSKTASKNEPNITVSVVKANTRDNTILDKARVCFNEADQLTKYIMREQSSRLYIPQNGQDFAVAYANGEKEMPINFKTAQNGTFTINLEIEGLTMDYLHLIDNMTGTDVDLLVTPSYTFEAKTTDYASRFKLVFNDNNGSSTGSGTFAYISDGSIIINNEEGATLQIVDMMGHVVMEGDAMNRVTTNGMTSGVYVLRLINGEKVQTQKIVIE